jgi:hypothetical protein
MAVNHLSDNDIQDFLEGNLKNRDEEIRLHLNECATCNKKFKEFSVIFNQVKIDTTPALSTSFASKVAAKAFSESEQSKKVFSPYIYYFAGLVCLIVAIWYTGIWSIFGRMMSALKITSIADFIGDLIISVLTPLAKMLHIDTAFLAVFILVLIVAVALDYIIRHSRQRTISYLV